MFYYQLNCCNTYSVSQRIYFNFMGRRVTVQPKYLKPWTVQTMTEDSTSVPALGIASSASAKPPSPLYVIHLLSCSIYTLVELNMIEWHAKNGAWTWIKFTIGKEVLLLKPYCFVVVRKARKFDLSAEWGTKEE